MSQLTLSLLNVPGVATLPTLEPRATDTTERGADDGPLCQERNPDTGKRCTGRQVRSIVTVSPTLVGFARYQCPVCGFGRAI